MIRVYLAGYLSSGCLNNDPCALSWLFVIASERHHFQLTATDNCLGLVTVKLNFAGPCSSSMQRACMCVYVHVCIHMCVCMCVCLYVHVCVQVCHCVCVCIFVCEGMGVLLCVYTQI